MSALRALAPHLRTLSLAFLFQQLKGGGEQAASPLRESTKYGSYGWLQLHDRLA